MKKVLLILTGISIFQASPASACSCLVTTPQESFESSSAVFAGRAIEVIQPSPVAQENSIPQNPDSPASQVRVIFQVSRVWKGSQKPLLLVVTPNSSAACGYSFQEGQQYLVYASVQESKLATGLCNGTKPLSLADEDLAVLGEGSTPTPDRSNREQLRPKQQFKKVELDVPATSF